MLPEGSNHEKNGALIDGQKKTKSRSILLPRDYSAKKPLHSITSSASASKAGGIARACAFAVLRLITNSNLADCITGMSAGLVPSVSARPAPTVRRQDRLFLHRVSSSRGVWRHIPLKSWPWLSLP